MKQELNVPFMHPVPVHFLEIISFILFYVYKLSRPKLFSEIKCGDYQTNFLRPVDFPISQYHEDTGNLALYITLMPMKIIRNIIK